MLSLNAKGKPIGSAEEVPIECGVMVVGEAGIDVLRTAPKRPSPRLPFAVWMALAKSSPLEREHTRMDTFKLP